jgi:hypothetical protein
MGVYINISTLPDEISKVCIKINGDGARMTRCSSFIALLCVVLSGVDEVTTSDGVHPIAMIKGSGNYDLMNETFRNVFREIHSLVKDIYS